PDLERQQFIAGRGPMFKSSVGNQGAQVLKFFVLGYEVRLAVQRHENCLPVIVAGANKYGPFPCLLVGAGSRYLLTLLPKDFYRLVEIAVRFGEGLLAIHHTGARHLSKLVYIL